MELWGGQSGSSDGGDPLTRRNHRICGFVLPLNASAAAHAAFGGGEVHVRCTCVPPLRVLLGSLLGPSSMESLGIEKFIFHETGGNEPKFYFL